MATVLANFTTGDNCCVAPERRAPTCEQNISSPLASNDPAASLACDHDMLTQPRYERDWQGVRPLGARRVVTVAVWILFLVWSAAVSARTPADEIFVDMAWVAEHDPVVLDAREPAIWAVSHAPGAINTPWYTFTSGSDSGLLLPEATIADWLGAHGINNERSVVVYGAWDAGWGEEGRIFWMLEYLGHNDAHILTGGYDAWRVAANVSPTLQTAHPPTTFVVHADDAARATRGEVLQMATDETPGVILDTRNLDEFQGATPYGEARGGRIPHAEHLDWRSMLRTFEAGENPLSAWDLAPEMPVVAYCTGGIRSGFAYALLRASGVENAANYDGSFWEWAADPSLPISH
jgi:thiosulfate/3-mercaptopyruvate sulfurtransferase